MFFEEFDKLTELSKNLKSLIPDKTNKEFTVGDSIVRINRDGDTVHVEIEQSSEDTNYKSEVRDIVEEYKELIEELDDCLFVEIVEDLSNKISIKEFDGLLNKEDLSKEEAFKLLNMIDVCKEYIAFHIENKIDNLRELYSRI